MQQGLTEEALTHVAEWRTSDLYSAEDKVAIEYAERYATDSHAIDDDLFRRLHEHFADDEILDLTLVVAKYLAMGRMMEVLRFDLACGLHFDDGAPRPR